MTKPMKFHIKNKKNQMIIRIPDTSDKDKKIQAVVTGGYSIEKEPTSIETTKNKSSRSNMSKVGANDVKLYAPVKKQSNVYDIAISDLK